MLVVPRHGSHVKIAKNRNSETPEETKLWTALLKEVMRRNSPLQMFLLLDQLQAEMAKQKA
jgi:hypothetical protein